MPVLSEADMRDVQQSLETDGYAVIRNVVSRGRLTDFDALLSEEYGRAKRSGLFKGGGTLSGHLNCFPGEASRFVYDEIAEQGIVDLVRAIDPAMAERRPADVELQPAGQRGAVLPHGRHLYTQAFLICNIAVVDTDLANGAIDLLPGTNRRFYRFWRVRGAAQVPPDHADPHASRATCCCGCRPSGIAGCPTVGEAPPDDVDHLRRGRRVRRAIRSCCNDGRGRVLRQLVQDRPLGRSPRADLRDRAVDRLGLPLRPIAVQQQGLLVLVGGTGRSRPALTAGRRGA